MSVVANMRIVTEFNLSDETIADMLITAVQGAGSWVIDYELVPVHGDVKVRLLTRGEDNNPDDEVRYETNYATLRDAFRKCSSEGWEDHIGEWVHNDFHMAIRDRDLDTGEVDAGHIDANSGYAWLQIALFGEARYS